MLFWFPFSFIKKEKKRHLVKKKLEGEIDGDNDFVSFDYREEPCNFF